MHLPSYLFVKNVLRKLSEMAFPRPYISNFSEGCAHRRAHRRPPVMEINMAGYGSSGKQREVLVYKSHRHRRKIIPWRSWSTVSISRHIYFYHERTTMTSETSENTIFARIYFTLCYLMRTFSRTSGSLVYGTCVTRKRVILKWHNNRQQTGWRLLAVLTVVSFLKLSKLNLKKNYKCLPLISGKKGILIVQKWKSAMHENLNKNSKCLSKVP